MANFELLSDHGVKYYLKKESAVHEKKSLAENSDSLNAFCDDGRHYIDSDCAKYF